MIINMLATWKQFLKCKLFLHPDICPGVFVFLVARVEKCTRVYGIMCTRGTGMSLNFVFGPAGSGKSTLVQDMLINESIKNPKESFLLIVPDQFTMQTQMDIVKRHPNKGILNIDVLSFGRLSYRVFSVTGKSEVPVLDDTGKSLVLRRVAGSVADKMPYIGRNLSKIGYIHEVKSQISEFMQYGLSVKDVQVMSTKVSNGLLQKKLIDLAVIYESFMEFNKDKFVTSEETLDQLRERLPMADFIKGSTIVFDGFTGFTPIQERVVLKLCELAKQVIITFDLSKPEMPSDIGGEEKLFYLSRKGATRLKTKASELGITVDDDVYIDGSNGRFKENAELSHLEANLFRFPVKEYAKPLENIELFACRDLDSEVSEICLKIHRLIETGKYAYRDIAVVTGNLESYGMLFENRMRELDMPVFIDRTSQIVLNPFTEYLKSALQIIIKDYSYESVFHFLRSGFTDFTYEETDRFDRYVSSLNIRGKSSYHKEFKKREKGLRDKAMADLEISLHEDVRKRLVEKLSFLERDAKTVREYAKNLYDFLKDNNSYEKLCEYEKLFEDENNLSKAREYAQIYKCIMELLDTLVELIGDEEMDILEFYQIFEAGINEIEVGTIPKNVDRIVVGDIERTRMSEVKILFFAGVNDGNIPKSTDKGGILSQIERETLSENGYELAPTPREEMYTQRLYLYMNMCKPTEKLYISYAGTGADGKSMRASYLVDVLKKMFASLEVKIVEEEPSVDAIVNLKDSLRYYSELLRDYVAGNSGGERKKLTEALLSIYEKEDFEKSGQITDAAFINYVAEPLSEEIVRLIYGDTIRTSISRMETYAGCAYSYFLQYGMGLKKNEEYEFAAVDLGTIYHGVLDCFSSELERRGMTWLEFSKEDGREMVEKAVRNYCEDYEQGLLKDDEQSAYTITKITRIMERTVDTLQFHIKRGKFMPQSHEYSFEREFKLSDDKKILLTGKIDRIDLYEADGKIYVKILDYKSGNKSIDITNVYHGIQQQLAVYMSEAIHHEKEINPGKDVVPSALLYYTIDNPMISGEKAETEEAVEEEIKKELRVEGLFENSTENIANLDENAAGESLVLPVRFKKDGDFDSNSVKRVASREELENMLDYVDRLIRSIGTRINDGDKKISPMCTDKSDPCAYCNFKSICRFDEKIPGYKKRDGKEVDEETAREKVMGGDADGLYLFN